MLNHQIIKIKTPGRGMINLTPQIAEMISHSEKENGLCHLFLQHTSASLIICENADQSVQDDMEAFMKRLVPDGEPLFQHIAEGPDDMPSHVRTILTQSSLTIPFSQNVLMLGVWQGIYLWEHRLKPHDRKIIVTLS